MLPGASTAISRQTLVLGLTVIILLAPACGGNDDSNLLRTQVALLQTQVAQPTSTPQPTARLEPDLVVGVSWRCDIYVGRSGEAQSGVGESCTIRYQSNYASEIQKTMIIQNIVADVTVRTSSGSAYHANVSDPPNRIVIGDSWPPK